MIDITSIRFFIQKPILPLIRSLLIILLGYSICHANDDFVSASERFKNFYYLQINRSSQPTGIFQFDSPHLVKQFYIENDWQPVWIKNKRSYSLAHDFLSYLNRAESVGLKKLRYHNELINSVLSHKASTNIESLYELELLLTDAFLSYVNDLLYGQVRPDAIFRDWQITLFEENVVSVLEQIISQGNIKQTIDQFLPFSSAYMNLVFALAKYRELDSNYTDILIPAGSALKLYDQGVRVALLKEKLSITDGPINLENDVFDSLTLQAAYRFQDRHGLETDGIIGQKTLAALNISYQQRIKQIEANLERMRWLPRYLGDKYIVVNIPDFTLNVIENDQNVLKSRVIVGKQSHETQVFSKKMTYLVFNPYWYVPHSISSKEILPELKADHYYLQKNRMRLFDASSGIEIDPNNISWNQISEREFSYKIRQEPGLENALGRVKFIFPNKYSIYMHDTPTRNLFSRSVRDFSHGCIRVEKAIELAKYLLQEQLSWTDEKITKVLRTVTGYRVSLLRDVPVYILYVTAWVDSGVIQFRDDIYGRDKKIINALAQIQK